MKGFVVGLAVARAINSLAVQIAKSEHPIGTEIRKKLLAKAETQYLIRIRDEIDAELTERREALT